MPETEDAFEEFWALMPANAVHPSRVPILETLRWIRESLSPIDLVDLFDGENITMWEAEHHLRALHRLGVVEPDPDGRDLQARRGLLDLPYRLTILDAGDGC